jgi:hypothetical protein
VSKYPVSDADKNLVAHLIAGNPNVINWLRDIGLITVDAHGQWQLSPSCEAAIAHRQECTAERTADTPLQ